jgi:hypothetical protein
MIKLDNKSICLIIISIIAVIILVSSLSQTNEGFFAKETIRDYCWLFGDNEDKCKKHKECNWNGEECDAVEKPNPVSTDKTTDNEECIFDGSPDVLNNKCLCYVPQYSASINNKNNSCPIDKCSLVVNPFNPTSNYKQCVPSQYSSLFKSDIDKPTTTNQSRKPTTTSQSRKPTTTSQSRKPTTTMALPKTTFPTTTMAPTKTTSQSRQPTTTKETISTAPTPSPELTGNGSSSGEPSPTPGFTSMNPALNSSVGVSNRNNPLIVSSSDSGHHTSIVQHSVEKGVIYAPKLFV